MCDVYIVMHNYTYIYTHTHNMKKTCSSTQEYLKLIVDNGFLSSTEKSAFPFEVVDLEDQRKQIGGRGVVHELLFINKRKKKKKEKERNISF